MAALNDELMESINNSPWKDIFTKSSNYNLEMDEPDTNEKLLNKPDTSTMKLKKEEMILYGLCPAQDEFFLTICEKCDLLVKPQALKSHLALRHGKGKFIKSKPIINEESLPKVHSEILFKSPTNTRSQTSSRSRVRKPSLTKSHLKNLSSDNLEIKLTLNKSRKSFCEAPSTNLATRLSSFRKSIFEKVPSDSTNDSVDFFIDTESTTSEEVVDCKSQEETKSPSFASSIFNLTVDTSKCDSQAKFSPSNSDYKTYFNITNTSSGIESSISCVNSNSSLCSNNSNKELSRSSYADKVLSPSQPPTLEPICMDNEVDLLPGRLAPFEIDSFLKDHQENSGDSAESANSSFDKPPVLIPSNLHLSKVAPHLNPQLKLTSNDSANNAEKAKCEIFKSSSIKADEFFDKALQQVNSNIKVEESALKSNVKTSTELKSPLKSFLNVLPKNITQAQNVSIQFIDKNCDTTSKNSTTKTNASGSRVVAGTTTISSLLDKTSQIKPLLSKTSFHQNIKLIPSSSSSSSSSSILSPITITQLPTPTIIFSPTSLLQPLASSSSSSSLTSTPSSLILTSPSVTTSQQQLSQLIMANLVLKTVLNNNNAAKTTPNNNANANVKTKSVKKSSKRKPSNPDFVLCKNRLYDPDKHCGVINADTQKPCTRFLTCKTHPLLLRRAVTGRSKPFDELMKEQKERRQALAKNISNNNNNTNNNVNTIKTNVEQPNDAAKNLETPPNLQRLTSLLTLNAPSSSSPSLFPSNLLSLSSKFNISKHNGVVLAPMLVNKKANINNTTILINKNNDKKLSCILPSSIIQQKSYQTITSSNSIINLIRPNQNASNLTVLTELQKTDLDKQSSSPDTPKKSNKNNELVSHSNNIVIKEENDCDVCVRPIFKRKRSLPTLHVKEEPCDKKPRLDGGEEEKDAEGGDDDDDTHSQQATQLPFHPRPAAVNGYNAWMYGEGISALHRSNDLFRSSFHHLLTKLSFLPLFHPSPHASSSSSTHSSSSSSSLFDKLLAHNFTPPVSQAPALKLSSSQSHVFTPQASCSSQSTPTSTNLRSQVEKLANQLQQQQIILQSLNNSNMNINKNNNNCNNNNNNNNNLASLSPSICLSRQHILPFLSLQQRNKQQQQNSSKGATTTTTTTTSFVTALLNRRNLISTSTNPSKISSANHKIFQNILSKLNNNFTIATSNDDKNKLNRGNNNTQLILPFCQSVFNNNKNIAKPLNLPNKLNDSNHLNILSSKLSSNNYINITQSILNTNTASILLQQKQQQRVSFTNLPNSASLTFTTGNKMLKNNIIINVNNNNFKNHLINNNNNINNSNNNNNNNNNKIFNSDNNTETLLQLLPKMTSQNGFKKTSLLTLEANNDNNNINKNNNIDRYNNNDNKLNSSDNNNGNIENIESLKPAQKPVVKVPNGLTYNSTCVSFKLSSSSCPASTTLSSSSSSLLTSTSTSSLLSASSSLSSSSSPRFLLLSTSSGVTPNSASFLSSNDENNNNNGIDTDVNNIIDLENIANNLAEKTVKAQTNKPPPHAQEKALHTQTHKLNGIDKRKITALKASRSLLTNDNKLGDGDDNKDDGGDGNDVNKNLCYRALRQCVGRSASDHLCAD